jgi:hypothetical protein
MKKNILRISILPLIILTVFALTDVQQKGNEKGNKAQGEHPGNGKNQEHGSQGNQQNDKPEQHGNKGRGNDNKENHISDRGPGNHGQENKPEQHGNKGNENDNKDRDHKSEHGNNRSDNVNNSDKNDDHGNGKLKDKGHREEAIRWAKNDNINWKITDFANRKHPKDQKKVTICHHTGNDSYPVTINVSENAVQAHLNHGDQLGGCAITYTDRWPKNYIVARETVYNNYETTWENMSYSEALLNYALQRLLGVKTNLDKSRSTLTPAEIQRREALILDLQNNVNSLQNQLDLTKQKLGNVNIVVML